MASSFTTVGGNTTVEFHYAAPTATIISIVGGCAEYLWNHGRGDHGGDGRDDQRPPILFSSLTNAQKLTLVDDYVKQCIIDAANTQKSIKAQDVAREAEEAAKYNL